MKRRIMKSLVSLWKCFRATLTGSLAYLILSLLVMESQFISVSLSTVLLIIFTVALFAFLWWSLDHDYDLLMEWLCQKGVVKPQAKESEHDKD